MRRGSAWPESSAATSSVVSVDRRCAVSLYDESLLRSPSIRSAMTASARRFGPRKSLGQHFLHDTRVVQRIIDAADLSPEDTVVEIGPGRGVLTRRLVQQAGRVIAVELDSQLCEELPPRLEFPENLQCVLGDAREVDLSGLAYGEAGRNPAGYKVVGNLPYYAANPIIRRTLESEEPPTLALFMVQREVAESMTAVPGNMRLLSVATQFYAEARVVCSVPPSAFRPPPKVRSSVVRLDVRAEPAVAVDDASGFFEVVRAGFSAPRKQLHNSLSHGLRVGTALGSAVLERAGIDGRRRPATLGIEEWAAVYQSWVELREGAECGGG